MTDRPTDQPPKPPNDPGGAADQAVDAGMDEAAQKLQRRAFLRQLTGDAVVATGRLAGLSTVLRRTVVAAGAAAIGEPDGPREADAAASADATQAAVEPPAVSTSPVDPPVIAASPAAAPGPAPDPTSQLTAHQNELLAHGTTAVLGVNDGSGAPHLTSSAFHWDGTVLRLPSELFAARVARIDGDPRVSALVELGDGAWVAVTGVATIVSGEGVETEMLTILRKQMTEEEAERAWSEMSAPGDRVVIRIRPTRFVWRLA